MRAGSCRRWSRRSLERGLAGRADRSSGLREGRPGRAAVARTPATASPRRRWPPRSATSTLDVPRDRDGTFEPRLVPKGARRLGGLDDMIISLYAGGMTVRDIQHHLARTLGTELSHETISKITDAVAEEVKAWQTPAAGGALPDHLPRRAGGEGPRRRTRSATRPRTSPSGSTWTASSTCWGSGCRPPRARSSGPGCAPSSRNRGVRDVLIVCCDGLTGFPEAIEATWPQATVQTCVVHLIRAAMRFVSYSDRKAVAAALRPIYTAADRRGRRGSELRRLRRVRPGQEVPGHGRDLGERLGAVHPVPGVPARAAQDHLHHQRDRVAELPAPQDHQEPRPLPQRRRRRQAAVAGDPRHRGQTRPRREPRNEACPRERTQSPRPARRRRQSPPLESSPRRTRPRLPRPHQPPPLTEKNHETDRLHRKLDRLAGRAARPVLTTVIGQVSGRTPTAKAVGSSLEGVTTTEENQPAHSASQPRASRRQPSQPRNHRYHVPGGFEAQAPGRLRTSTTGTDYR